MKLDTTAKIVTLISVIVGIMISVAGYFTSIKLQSLDAGLRTLDQNSKTYDLSPRLFAEFRLPLARSFAEDYSNKAAGILIPTSEQMNEFKVNIPNWKSRKGLMTGDACAAEGLKARQVIMLILKNIGHADAIDVKIKALKKKSPYDEPSKGWQEMLNNKTVPYYDINAACSGWETIEIRVSDLLGQSSPEANRNDAEVVLASVSGTTTFYGTVLVPIEVSWTNKITNNYEVHKILESEAANIRSSLLGAEIGTACK